MNALDVTALNEQARVLYDAAFAAGRRAGDNEGSSRVSEDRLRSGVDLAVCLLSSSVAARSRLSEADDWPERVLAMYARSALGRVSATSDVMKALTQLQGANLNNAPGGINRRAVDQALDGLTSYRETLGGYRW